MKIVYKGIPEYVFQLDDYQKFLRFLEKKGVKLLSHQKFWSKKATLKKNFFVFAPTGFGKTFFLVNYLLFRSKICGWRTIYIVPSKNLVKQIVSALKKEVEVLSDLEDWEVFSRKINDFQVVVCSAYALRRLFRENMQVKPFDLVIVDDVDSFMKSSKTGYPIMLLAGYTEEEIKECRKNVFNETDFSSKGQVIFSSATASPGAFSRVVMGCLKFGVMRSDIFYRNVDDYYILSEKPEEHLKTFLENEKLSGIIFVSGGLDKETKRRLKDLGVISDGKVIEFIENPQVRWIFGSASYYGKLVRGLDVPKKIVVTVFLEPPHFSFTLQDKYSLFLASSRFIFWIEDKECKKLYYEARNIFRRLPIWERADIRKYIHKYPKLEEKITLFAERFKKIITPEKLKILGEKAGIVFRLENGKLRFLIPDVKTFIQASGRASRFYGDKIIKGVSIIISRDKELLERFLQVAKERYGLSIERFEKKQFEKSIKEALEDRKSLVFDPERLSYHVKAFIVESPTKAKTISKIFGGSGIDYSFSSPIYEIFSKEGILLVSATQGHFIDLVEDEEEYGIKMKEKRIEVIQAPIKFCPKCNRKQVTLNNYCRICGEKLSLPDTIRKLQYLNFLCDECIIATDDDREGEKIAFDIANFFPKRKIRRLRLRAITKEELKKALYNLDSINLNLVQKQVVRRIVDRYLGFLLSEELQRTFEDKNFSAGRVQSVVLDYVVKRNEEVKQSEKMFTVITLENNEKIYVEGVHNNITLKVLGVKEKEINPPPPYNTADLLKEASIRLKLSSEEIMSILQDLFEYGLISYHRTSSYGLTEESIALAKRIIAKYFDEKDFYFRRWGNPEPHEAIHPVQFVHPEDLEVWVNEFNPKRWSKKHIALYWMIWERFLASQMKPAKIKVVEVNVAGKTFEFLNKVIYEGWTKIIQLQIPKKPAEWRIKEIKIEKRRTVYPPNESDIISFLQDVGVGRPSTYAEAISVNFRRGYLYKVKKVNFIVPTKKGKLVWNFLKNNFPKILDYELTRKLEETLEQVPEKVSPEKAFAQITVFVLKSK